MEVRNCIRCGKMYRPITGKRICPDCVKAEQEEFQRVKEYVRRHPTASVMEVSKETGVSTKKIYEYVREGRLVAASGADWGLKCEQCGEPLTTGRLCPKCAGKLEAEITGRPRPGAFMGQRKDRGGGRVTRDKFIRRFERD